MNTRVSYLPFLLMGVLFMVSCEPVQKDVKKATEEEVVEVPDKKVAPKNCMVMINATNQGYSYLQPWNKKSPFYSEGFGVYIGEGFLLTTANMVQNANFIQISTHDKEETAMVGIAAIDEEINLALLKPVDSAGKELLEGLTPLELAGDESEDPALGDELEIWQFNHRGLDVVSKGVLEATYIGTPTIMPFVLYQIKSPVNTITGEETMPVLKNGKIIGMSLWCDTSEQMLGSLPSVSLRSFIERAMDEKGYQGLPLMGVSFEPLMNPVFRKYLKVDEKNGGVYLSKVQPFSSADKAGLKKGDVLLSINGHVVDSRGLIQDQKLGPVNCSMLLRDLAKVGDRVDVEISRNGERKNVEVVLDREGINKALIPIVNDSGQPRYLIYGGLLFQPMSFPYLTDVFGGDTSKMRTEIIDVLNSEEKLRKEGREEILLLTMILPTPATHGYGDYRFTMLEKIDGQIPRNLKHLSEILKSADDKDIIEIRVNGAPYILYMSPEMARQSNEYIRQAAFSQLENL